MTLPQDIVARLRAWQGEPYVTRFAPSPTGFLHLGHVVSALFVWGVARAVGARIILRIEDHDRARCRPEYEKALHEDLAWLGFEADHTSRQSDDWNVYEQAIAIWRRDPGVFACTCSRKEILARTAATGAGRDEELRYDGWCRAHTPDVSMREKDAIMREKDAIMREKDAIMREKDVILSEAKDPASRAGIRLVMPAARVSFDDLWLGRQIQEPATQCGDVLLKDRDGFYTYQCAVVADDVRQGVNLIIRGQDLTASSGRQILMARWLGREKDAFFLHHPLAQDAQGRKLAKRDFSEAVGKRRAAGVSAAALLGEACHAAGLTTTAAPRSLPDCMELFR